MTKSFAFSQAGDDWHARIRAMPAPQVITLAARARKAPLFAHAYAFHLNFRFGGMTPAALLNFAVEQGLVGVKIHVEDGEAESLQSMSQAELQEFDAQAVALDLAVHSKPAPPLKRTCDGMWQ